MATGLVWHELYMWHHPGQNYALMVPAGLTVQPAEYIENPETKRRIKNLLDVSGLSSQLVHVEPRHATDNEILRVHTREYLERIRSLSNNKGGEAGLYAPFGPGGYEISTLAAGGGITLADAVLDGAVANGYALVRPPGHHAVADRGMGGCIFCNSAITGRHLLEERGLGRIAFVDWDVHHGNGTEAAFWTESRALTISIHQDGVFPPDRGLVSQAGEGEGKGYNINVPLPAGSGVGAYEAAFDRVVIPALRAYGPDMIVVPSGLDADVFDLMGQQMMTSEGYRSLARKLMGVADDVCAGRIMMLHEGGYSVATVPYIGLAIIEELSGIRTGISDPFLEGAAGYAGQDLQPHQDAMISEAEVLVKDLK